MIRLALVILISLPLAGCFETIKGSIAGGECRVFEAPKYAVRGYRSYDQDWIDGNIEAGVGGCGWKRPAVRPVSLDVVPGQKKIVASVKKRGLIKRIKERVWPKAAAPVVVVPEAPAPVIAEPSPPPAPPPKPPDQVDELLHPSR